MSEPSKELGVCEILHSNVLVDGSNYRKGMTYLIYLNDSQSEVNTEFWLDVMDDGKCNVFKMLKEDKSGIAPNVTPLGRAYPFNTEPYEK
jgi:hypothetical protein